MSKNYFLFFVIIVITSCENDINRIMQHKDAIITLSQNKEIYNDKERGFYMLTTYSSGNKVWNEYFFNREEKYKRIFYTLFRDSIQLTPDTVIRINRGDSNYHTEICNYYQRVSQILESYGIKSISGERYINDPILTICMNDGRILIYVSNRKTSKDNAFEEFEKIKDNWYLLK